MVILLNPEFICLQGREAMEWIIKKINIEVEDFMTTYKRGTSELKNSFGKIQDSARKSMGDISNALKDMDDLQNLANASKPLPRI